MGEKASEIYQKAEDKVNETATRFYDWVSGTVTTLLIPLITMPVVSPTPHQGPVSSQQRNSARPPSHS